MADSVRVSDSLYRAMIEQMALRLPLEVEYPDFGPTLPLISDSSFRIAAAVLARAGRGEWLPVPGHPLRVFRFLPARRSPTDAPALDEVLAAWLAVFSGFEATPGGGLLPTTREPFVPPADYGATMEFLVAAGYATRQGETVQWTDQALPAMRACLLWTEEGEDLNDWARAGAARSV